MIQDPFPWSRIGGITAMLALAAFTGLAALAASARSAERRDYQESLRPPRWTDEARWDRS